MAKAPEARVPISPRCSLCLCSFWSCSCSGLPKKPGSRKLKPESSRPMLAMLLEEIEEGRESMDLADRRWWDREGDLEGASSRVAVAPVTTASVPLRIISFSSLARDAMVEVEVEVLMVWEAERDRDSLSDRDMACRSDLIDDDEAVEEALFFLREGGGGGALDPI